MKNILGLSLFLITSLILLVQLYPTITPSAQYLSYLYKFNKPIPSSSEFAYRQNIFLKYLEQMEHHNTDPTKKWKMGINQFSDITTEEFISTYLGEKASPSDKLLEEEQVNAGFVQDINWNTSGIVTPVKNQGRCGSCWAFAATAAHQSYQIKNNKYPARSFNLSEQQLVDCSDDGGNSGCNGGLAREALQHVLDHGQTQATKYPYVAATQTCRFDGGKYSIKGVGALSGCSEIESAIQKTPLTVRVDASNWKDYSSGIFDNCNKSLNHAVFLVGSSDRYWTIKNSWSPAWGEGGFIRLAKGDTCGLCYGPTFIL